MAPLSQAINAEYASQDGDRVIFRGDVDPEWCIGAVPNGGYVLGLVLEAVIKHQASSQHPDPIHVSAHFIHPTHPGSFEVHIREIKKGKGFKNLSATFLQKGREEILTHMIFGVLEPTEQQQSGRMSLTVAPSSPHAPSIPVNIHPSRAEVIPDGTPWSYVPRRVTAKDPKAVDSVNDRVTSAKYLTFTDKTERIRSSMMPFFADAFSKLPPTLPATELGNIWLPTLYMRVEFKFPIPKPSEHISQRTVAISTQSRFVTDPSGRHDLYYEIWTAPADVGDKETPATDDWKKHQRCLAVATQMALVVPKVMNLSAASKL